MTRRVLASRSRRNHHSQRGRDSIQPRDPQAMSDWGYVMALQLARLPAGRLVVEYRGFGEGVSVLSGERKGDGA